MSNYKSDVLLIYPFDTVTNSDIVKCYYCDTDNKIKNFYDWLDNQTKIKVLSCEKCGKKSCVKIFANTSVSREKNTNQLITVTKYYTFCVPENKTRQGRGPECTGRDCKQPTYTRVIDQDRFINKEIISCKFCGTVNEISATSPSLRDSPKIRRVGEWITVSHHEKMRREKEKSNIEKFNNTHNPKPKNIQVTTQNRFDGLINHTDPDMMVECNDEETENCEAMEQTSIATSVSGSRKRAISPDLNTSSKRGKDNTHDLPASQQPQQFKNNNKTSCDLQKNQNKSKQLQNNKQPQQKKLPKIVCTHEGWVESTYMFKNITEIARTHNCELKTDKRSGKLFFTPRQLENRKNLIEDLKNRPDFEFHTHGTKLERRPSKKVVAKGVITSGHNEEEIIHDIKERYGMTPERAVPLRNSALVLVFSGETDMRDIKNITTILYQRVKIEKYRIKPTAVTQCKNCLEFGHVQAHCGRKKVCEIETEVDEDGKTKETCSKCHQPGHSARQARCPLFQEEIKKQRERRLRFQQANNKTTAPQTKQKISSSSDIKPGTSYAQAVHTVEEKTPILGTEEIINKMFAMFQTMQQQFMNQMQSQMQQLIQLIRNG